MRGRDPLAPTLLLALAWGAWQLPLFFMKGTYQAGIEIGSAIGVLFFVTLAAQSAADDDVLPRDPLHLGRRAVSLAHDPDGRILAAAGRGGDSPLAVDDPAGRRRDSPEAAVRHSRRRIDTRGGPHASATAFFGLLLLLADIYAILKIAQSSETTGRKALWIVLVVVLPLVGLVIWFLLGPGGRSAGARV